MSKYGVKLLWGGYRTYLDEVVGFSPWAYDRWKADIQPGTRMLLYETTKNKGAQAIVSEVEVVHGFAETAKLALVSPTEEHKHLVKIKVIHTVGAVTQIPRKQVQTILRRPHYPQQNDSWTPISEAEYRDFIKIWDGS